MADPSIKDQAEAFGKAFGTAVERWGNAAETLNPIGAVTGSVGAIGAMTQRLLAFIRRLVQALPRVLSRLTEEMTGILADLTEMLVGEVNGLLDAVVEMTGQAAEIGLGAILGFFELVKKTIYLLIDFLEKNFPPNNIGAFICLHLDMINNLLGNIAELVSPKTGQMARRFRMDMYEQLSAIRVAEGANPRKEFDPDLS